MGNFWGILNIHFLLLLLAPISKTLKFNTMHNSSQYQSVIQALNACAATCDHCYAACFQEQDLKMMARCI